jgi:monoamine oxidase
VTMRGTGEVDRFDRALRGGGRRPRTSGMALMRRLYALHDASLRRGVPVDELSALAAEHREHGEPVTTRRQFIARGAAATAGLALAHGPAAAAARALAARRAPRIAIVGAGLAGLRCAHMLFTESGGRPVASTVYEAHDTRAGGRCWTLRGFFHDGLITEHGGSFLNSNQTAVRRLAALLGLREEVVTGGDLPQGEEVFFIDGAYYTLEEASADWRSFGFAAFRKAAREQRTEAGETHLDAMSVPEWLESTPIGAGSRFGKLMQANTVTENGGDPSDQSALDLIELLSGNPRSSLLPLPGDDERFHVVGGNDQLVAGMIGELPAHAVQYAHTLHAIRANVDGSVTLSFEVSGRLSDVTADFVVLALPFSTLREVDLTQAGLSPAKLRVIATMGMGSNAKIHLELSRKTWPALGFSGATYGEWDRLASAWDDCVQLGPSAEPALYLAFPGARVGRTGLTGGGHGPAPAADVSFALSEIEHVFPGTSAAFTGRAYEDHWALDPFVRGAYSYYRVGQASSYGQMAGVSEGSFLFAGEHTSIANTGFLDGAVETGERAARLLMARLR